MRTEVLVSYHASTPHLLGSLKPLLEKVSVREYKEKYIVDPFIPQARVLHAEFVNKRNEDREKGTYTPGALLPVQFNQDLLRQLFITLGRTVRDEEPIDWYNPTQPFEDGGDKIMAVRIEPRNSELSVVGFMKEDQDGKYKLDNTRPIIDMAQDPSITFDDNGNPVLGVVRIQADGNGKVARFHTEQFRGPDTRGLDFFQKLNGKDNRPVQLEDGRVRAFFRPQGKFGGFGKLAFRDFTNWEAYAKDGLKSLTQADLLITNFKNEDHGGPNFPLPDGQVYGHTAYKEYGERGEVVKLHYYDTWMLTDVKTGQLLYQKDHATGKLKPLIKVVADRSDFPVSEETPDKDPENPERIHDVVFMSGREKLPNGRVRITNGFSDTRIGVIDIEDPMLSVDTSRLILVA